VRNEAFTTASNYDVIASGRLYCSYKKSHFLDYVKHATTAEADYPGPLTHIGINYLDHIIDVVAVDLPVIKRLTI
jgi:hypothetical protein